ncbi:MAG: alpha/beta hydrolase [Flavobacteriaceae bacterium]
MKHYLTTTFLFLLSINVFAQEKTFTTQEVSVNEFLNGTLYTPEKAKKTNLVILIAGSGPTDRDGNQTGMENNSLKFLAEGLAQNNISVYSYDKRIFVQAKSQDFDESSLSFEDFIDDAVAVINHFKKGKNHKKIFVAGHSEGSLIGMVAVEKAKADGFISIAGTGSPIDEVLKFQIKQNAPFLLEQTTTILDSLKNGKTVEITNPALFSLFRPSVQPYMISWLKYNPQTEIKKLKTPVMIINGTSDLQITVSEAELLKQAKPEARYLIVEKMNHVLKEVNDINENQKSYTDPNLPVMPELIEQIARFIHLNGDIKVTRGVN